MTETSTQAAPAPLQVRVEDLEELEWVGVDGPRLPVARVLEIIRQKSFLYTEAFMFPGTWLDMLKQIAALEAENVKLRAERDEARVTRSTYDDLLRTHGLLQSMHRERQEFAGQQYNRAERAEAEVARLTEALKPFADAAAAYDEPDTDYSGVMHHEDEEWAENIVVGDLRRALAALKGSTDAQA